MEFKVFLKIFTSILWTLIQLLDIQYSPLRGPMLVGIPVWPVDEKKLVIQDVGRSNVWTYDLTEYIDTVYNFQIASISPNGCFILLKATNHQEAILSIFNGDLIWLPNDNSSALSETLWSPDGKYVTKALREGDRTVVYFIDPKTLQRKSLFEGKYEISLKQWLSKHELLFWSNGLVVFDSAVSQIRSLDLDVYPAYQIIGTSTLPSGWEGILYRIEASPNKQMLAKYFDLEQYHSAQQESLEAKEFVETVPRSPGFDIYFYNANVSKHVSIDDHYIANLEWSPSSKYIAVTTGSAPESAKSSDTPGGIYIYDIENEKIQKVDEAILSPYERFEPTWSPDEEWIVIYTGWGNTMYTINGLALFHLTDEKIVELSEQFDGTNRLYWSPVMDYSETLCSAGE